MSAGDKWFLVLLIPALLGVLVFLVWWNFQIASGVVAHFGQDDPTLSKGLAVVLDVVLIMGLLLKTRRNDRWVNAAIWVPLGFIIAAGVFTGFLAGGIPGAVIFILPVVLLIIVEQNLLPFLPGSGRREIPRDVPTGDETRELAPTEGGIQEDPIPTGDETREIPTGEARELAPVVELPREAPTKQSRKSTREDPAIREIAQEISNRDPLPGRVAIQREFDVNESQARRIVREVKEKKDAA